MPWLTSEPAAWAGCARPRPRARSHLDELDDVASHERDVVVGEDDRRLRPAERARAPRSRSGSFFPGPSPTRVRLELRRDARRAPTRRSPSPRERRREQPLDDGPRSRRGRRRRSPARHAPMPVEDRVDDALGALSVHGADDRRRHRPPLRLELTGAREAALDPGRDLLERAGLVERARFGDVAVVLADHALRGPRLAGRRPFVVEDADRRPVVDERVEQHRAGVDDDGLRVLEDRREHLDVREARLLHRRPGTAERRGEALAPLAVARVGPKEEREALARARFGPPRDEPLEEGALVGRVRRRVPHHRDDRTRGVEPVAAENLVEGRRAVAARGRRPPAATRSPRSARAGRRGSGRGRRASARSGRRSRRARSRSRPSRRCDPSSRRSRRSSGRAGGRAR